MLWDNSGKSDGRRRVTGLFRDTSGSAGLDLCSSSYTVLTPEMKIQALPTGVYSPLPDGTVGLLLRRSSSTIKGLLIAPGVIDADYTGKIKIMAHSPQCITTIASRQHIAQLILVPAVQTKKAFASRRGECAFGSSDSYWVQAITNNRPEFTLRINGKLFTGILDTGADVSVIAERH